MNRPFLAAGLAALLLPSTTHAQAPCRAFEPGETIATLSDDRIDEASGIAASRRSDGVFWVHNDSGDSARVFAIDDAGATLATVTLPDISARDFEDIAIGPCSPADMTPCVWVADFGDNSRVRGSVQLHRFPEPAIDDIGEVADAADVVTIDFTYADGARNAETLLVHPTTGRVFVVEKSGGDPHLIWEVPVADAPVVATRVGELNLGESALIGGLVTGGDFSPDGTELAVRTYQAIYTLCGDDIEALFVAEPVRTIGIDLFQSEALTYARDGVSLWTTTEVRSSEDPPLVRMRPISTAGEDMGAGHDAGPATRDVGTAPTDAGADVPPGRTDAADVQTPASPAGCSCATNRAADEPWTVVGLLLVGLLARRRKRSS